MTFMRNKKLKAFSLLAAPAAAVAVWQGVQAEPAPATTYEAAHAAAAASGSMPKECTISAYGRAVDGSSFWNTTAQGIPDVPVDTNCMLDQFSINNFLYLVGDDSSGNPRFMSLAPWYDMLPAYGAPADYSGTYSKLNGVLINNTENMQQAGDGFELMDVNNQMTAYDIRVNEPFYDYVKNWKLYTSVGMTVAEAAFNLNSKVGGIWLPAGDTSNAGAMEIKTSWRAFGDASKNLCPSDIMHCETDSKGDSWGLVGMHLVQKTQGHGEFIWATFEHVGNSPDCSTGGTNPIAQNPTSPTGASLNMNKNISSLNGKTGWNYFDYASYTSAGGSGGICSFPTQSGGQDTLCLTSPEGAQAGDWVPVNICRTQPIPASSDVCANSMTDPTNLSTIACLNQSLASNFPSSLASKWQNYQLMGMEWLFNGSTGDGAVTKGCFTYDENDAKDACPNYPGGNKGGELGVPHYTRTGSTQMANSTMETWMQADMYLESKFSGTVQANDCFACHQPQTRSYQGDMSHIFGRVREK
ncbi:MAG: hypothetical protein HWE08_08585 [Alphaproteobacteria bacterium]|nr:hypothetical protein [Alphaproteobacteria bacterium]